MNDFDLKKTQILDRIDLVELISEHVRLRRSGRRWVGLCPFHSEKTPSFTVNPDRGIFKCFGCGKGGDAFRFIMERENVEFREALHMLADKAGVELKTQKTEGATGPGRRELTRINGWAAGFFRNALADERIGGETRAYLRNRGLSDEMVERFGLGLATERGPRLAQAAEKAGIDESALFAADLLRRAADGRVYETFRERLMFPIRDVMDRVLGFGGRTLIDDKAKYINTRQNLLFDKGRGLYGIDLARRRMSETNRAVLVEGYTDCIALHQAGFAEAVATLGTALTQPQVDLIRRYCDEVILLFDSDSAGEAAADRAIQVALPRYLAVRLARVPDGKDPADFLAEHPAGEFSAAVDAADDALEFKWLRTRERFAAERFDSRRREAVLDFLQLVSDACFTGAVDAIQRGLIANRVAALLEMPAHEVHGLLARDQRQRERRSRPAAAPDRGQAPADGLQAAWTDLLKALLNEPGLVTTIPEFPDPETIAHPRDRRIVRTLLDMVEQLGEFQPSELSARLGDPDDAVRVAELTHRGAERGNYDQTLAVALHRIRQGSRVRTLEEAKARMTGRPPSDANDLLKTIHGEIKEMRHFAPRRLIRRGSDNVVPEPTERTDGT